MDQTPSEYGDFIRKRRTELQFKQREIANACDITDSAIAHIERGFRLPSSKVLRKISSALGLSRDEERALFEMVQRCRAERTGFSEQSRSQSAALRPVAGLDVEPLDNARFEHDLRDIKGLREAYLNLREAMSNPRTHMAVMTTLAALAREAKSDSQ